MEKDSGETPSPSTSASPASISENTVLRDTEPGFIEEGITFSDCQKLAKAVNDCSKSLIEGNWVNIPDIRGTTPRFIPGSFESAKEFLRASVESLPRSGPRRSGQSLSNTPLSSRKAPDMGVCHGCHGTMGGGSLQGSAPGKNICSLPHSLYCKGGIVGTETWAPCPPGYIYNSDLDLASGSGFDSTLHTFQFQGGNSSTPAVGGIEHEAASQQGAHYAGLQQRLTPQQPPAHLTSVHQVSLPSNVSSTTDSLPGGRRLIEREFPIPGNGYGNTGAGSGDVQNKIDAHRAENQMERHVIDRPTGNIDITSLRDNPQLRAEVEAVMESVVRHRIPSLAAHQSAGPGHSNTGTIPKVVSSLAPTAHTTTGPQSSLTLGCQHPTYSQQTYPQPTWSHGSQTAPYNPISASYPDQTHHLSFGLPSTNLSLPQKHPVRHVPGHIPGPASKVHVQQPGQYVGHQVGNQQYDIGFCYEWVTDSMGRRLLMRSQLPPPLQPQPLARTRDQNHINLQQQVTQPQPVTVSPHHYRTEFRCSPTTGKVWTVQVPVQVSTQPPETVMEWRVHPYTGERYQVPVQPPSQQYLQSRTPQPQLQEQYNLSHQQPQQSLTTTPRGQQRPLGSLPEASHLQTSYQCQDQFGDNSVSKQDGIAGIVSLFEGGDGTRKGPKVIEFAKKCPSKWSKSATTSNINLPLYAWGVLEEIEAALTGRVQSLPSSTILGKLRHLKNTLEVCCQNSTPQDYTGYGWTLAKDYANKVSDEIDQGKLAWQDMPAEVKTSTLMSATMENPRPHQKLEPKKPKASEEKVVCSTYNKCTTENKCDYEVANPNKTCQRKHECSWCRTHKNQGWKHQEWKCRNKNTGGSD